MLKAVINTLLIALILISSGSGTAALAVPATPNAVNPEFIKAKKEANLLQSEITAKQKELDNLNADLEKSSRRIIVIYQQLSYWQQKLDRQRRVINQRVREVYKNSYNNNLIAYLLTASNLSDFWQRISFISRVNTMDYRLFMENRRYLRKIKKYRQEIADRKLAMRKARLAKVREIKELNKRYQAKELELVKLKLKARPSPKPVYVSGFSLPAAVK